jgi:hypothetical protein
MSFQEDAARLLDKASDELESIRQPLQTAMETILFVQVRLTRVSGVGLTSIQGRLQALKKTIEDAERTSEAISVAIDDKAREIGSL